MGRHDWYRHREWSAPTEAAFEAKFARTRQPWSRWQYLTIQAGSLRAARPEVSASLYERSLGLKGLEAGWVSRSLQALGELALDRGDDDAALTWLRQACEACEPDKRGIVGTHKPERQLGALLWLHGKRAEGSTLLGPAPVVPVEPMLAPPRDVSGVPYASPDDAGEGVVVSLHIQDVLGDDDVAALFAASPAALVAIDRLLLQTTTWSLLRPWQDHGRFELPGYVGRCLVKAGATWVPGPTLLDWALDTPSGRRQLYPMVWAALEQGRPLSTLGFD